jgi:hypothetical protein
MVGQAGEDGLSGNHDVPAKLAYKGVDGKRH